MLEENLNDLRAVHLEHDSFRNLRFDIFAESKPVESMDFDGFDVMLSEHAQLLKSAYRLDGWEEHILYHGCPSLEIAATILHEGFDVANNNAFLIEGSGIYTTPKKDSAMAYTDSSVGVVIESKVYGKKKFDDELTRNSYAKFETMIVVDSGSVVVDNSLVIFPDKVWRKPKAKLGGMHRVKAVHKDMSAMVGELGVIDNLLIHRHLKDPEPESDG